MIGAFLRRIAIALGKALLAQGLAMVTKRLGEKKAADLIEEAVEKVAAKVEKAAAK